MYHVRHAQWRVIGSGLKEAADVISKRLKRSQIDQSEDVQQQHLQQVLDGFTVATRDYIARPYPGSITLIRSTEFLQHPWKKGQGERWAILANGGLHMHVIAGLHDDLFEEPMVGALAAYLKDRVGDTSGLDR